MAKNNCKHLWVAKHWESVEKEEVTYTYVKEVICQKCLKAKLLEPEYEEVEEQKRINAGYGIN